MLVLRRALASSDRDEIVERWRLVVDAYALVPRAEVIPTIVARMATCAADIQRNAAAGSPRHELLAARDDHLAILAARAWTLHHRSWLDKAVTQE